MAIDADTERLMNNWARWRDGGGLSTPITAAYGLEARGRREEVSIPLINGEAVDVDAAVEDLPEPLKHVVVEFWCKPGTVRNKANRCGSAVDTFYRKLEDAHYRIRTFMGNRKRQADLTREAFKRRA